MTDRAIITDVCPHCDGGVVRMDRATAKRLRVPEAWTCWFCEGAGRRAVSPTRAELMGQVRDELGI